MGFEEVVAWGLSRMVCCKFQELKVEFTAYYLPKEFIISIQYSK